jgi:hypothetical protein
MRTCRASAPFRSARIIGATGASVTGAKRTRACCIHTAACPEFAKWFAHSIGGNARRRGSEASPGGFDGALCGVAHPLLELRKDPLDRVQVGAVGRREEYACASSPDHRTDACSAVGAEIVEDDDVASFRGGNENLLDIGEETLAINGAVNCSS